jgi:hypothetical protein
MADDRWKGLLMRCPRCAQEWYSADYLGSGGDAADCPECGASLERADEWDDEPPRDA